jgi:PAS domain-containing protein
MSIIDIPALSLDQRLEGVFGENTDPMFLLDERAAELIPDYQTIVWECDAQTFVFSHVSQSAEEIVGYPARRWVDEPTFWADVVLHHDDRDESVTYCASETACDRDHDFEYRARTADGRVIRLRDVVRVVPPMDGHPKRLRGIMLVVG